MGVRDHSAQGAEEGQGVCKGDVRGTRLDAVGWFDVQSEVYTPDTITITLFQKPSPILIILSMHEQ